MYATYQFKELVGIIGGTGPEATNYFTSLLIKYKGHVNKDQDHIPFLVFNNTQIPDRSKYLLYGGESPVPEMVRTGHLLKRAGATFLVIPCNTAHAFAKDLEKGVGIPVMNMIEETVKYIANKYGDATKVGLLATTGTVSSKVYHQTFKQFAPQITLLTPEEKKQAEVMQACYDIKKFSADEHSYKLLNDAAQDLLKSGAEVIILGCTEIPLALTPEKCNFNRVDPMEVLAKKVITKTSEARRSIYDRIINRLKFHNRAAQAVKLR